MPLAQPHAAAVSHTLPPTPSKQPQRTYLLTCPLMEEMVRACMVRCIGLHIEEAKVANLDLLCEKPVVTTKSYQKHISHSNFMMMQLIVVFNFC